MRTLMQFPYKARRHSVFNVLSDNVIAADVGVPVTIRAMNIRLKQWL